MSPAAAGARDAGPNAVPRRAARSRQLHRASAPVLLAFLALHMANHAAGLGGLLHPVEIPAAYLRTCG